MCQQDPGREASKSWADRQCVCMYVCLCHCVYSWCVCKIQRLQSQTKASLFVFVHYHKWWVQAQHLETVVFVRQYLTWNKCSFVTFEEFQRNWELSLTWWDEVFITSFIQAILNQSHWWLTLGDAWCWLKKDSNLLEFKSLFLIFPQWT